MPADQEDDVFGMLATVSDQRKARGNDSKGVRPVLVTNDRFFDHRKKMRDQSLFHEWYTRHCYQHDQKRSLKHIPTNVFNRRIRCHDWLDENEEDTDFGGKVWHFPVSGWGFNERFVVRVPIPRGSGGT